MPTGYTANVQDGTITDFSAFAMHCARAFGALITMRDDPMDAPIPDEFLPSDYYARSLEADEAELIRLEGLSGDEITAEHAAAIIAHAKSRDDSLATKATHKARYEAMLSQVKSWEAPTPDHVELKSFMAKQLTESIDFDCRDYSFYHAELPPVTEWQEERLIAARKSVERSRKSMAEEIERCANRSQWVRDLLASLTPTADKEPKT